MVLWKLICMFFPGNFLNPLKIFGTRNKPDESQTSQQPKPSAPPGSAADGRMIINIPEKLGETTQGRRYPTKPLGEIQEGQDIIPGAGASAAQFPPGERSVPTEHYTQGENILDTTTPLIAKRSQSSHSLEILKSIVYGGLMELIASLSIIASATACHATTLNTVALGLANLIGGIFVLFHNVKDLRYEASEESRYLKLLGRRENFSVHIIFVLLSYVVFGLVPPAVFGFTFRATDDQDLKLVAVAGSSLLCIFLLSIAKVITRRHHTCAAYSKTVLYYVTGAATASGIAYAAGHLLERYMNNLGWFDAKPVEQLLIPGNKTWASF